MSVRLTGLMDSIERLLDEAKKGKPVKQQILNMLSAIEQEWIKTISSHVVTQKADIINTVLQVSTPIPTLIQYIRYAVMNGKYEEAFRLLLGQTLSQDAERIQGLREAVVNANTAIMLVSQGLREEAARISQVYVTPPTDLLFGAPPITISLWNSLVRNRELEKENAANGLRRETEERLENLVRNRQISPAEAQEILEQFEEDFENAWRILYERGYAELSMDRRGREVLTLRR